MIQPKLVVFQLEIEPPQAFTPELDCFGQAGIDRECAGPSDRIPRGITETSRRRGKRCGIDHS